MEDTYVRFEPNPLKIQAWRARLQPPRAPQEDSTSPAELYARAVPTLLRWKDRLVESTLWREVSDHRAGLPPGILCVLEGVAPGSPAVEPSYPSTSVSSNLSINSVWAGSVDSSSSSNGAAASFLQSVRSRSRSSGGGTPTPVLDVDGSAAYHRSSPLSIAPPPPALGLPPGPVPSVGGAVLALPAELSAFIEYRAQLEDIFQDPLLFYPYLDRKQELVLEAFDDATPTTHDHDLSAAASTLTDIFYLLQLLIPGMLLIVHDTLTFVNKFNVAVPSPSERNGFSTHGQSQNYHGRSTTLFEISLGNDTPAPSPKEFTAPTRTASRNGGGGGGSSSSGGGGNLSRVMLTRTRRGVPPAQWILNNAQLLEEIFGRACLRAFHDCAEDRSRANWTTVYAAHGKRLEPG